MTYTNFTALQTLAAMEAVQADQALHDKVLAMITAEEKKRANATNAPRVESLEKREAKAMIKKMMAVMVANGNSPVSAMWIAEHVPGSATSSRAIPGKMITARNCGWVAYAGYNDAKQRLYTVTAAGVAAIDKAA